MQQAPSFRSRCFATTRRAGRPDNGTWDNRLKVPGPLHSICMYKMVVIRRVRKAVTGNKTTDATAAHSSGKVRTKPCTCYIHA